MNSRPRCLKHLTNSALSSNYLKSGTPRGFDFRIDKNQCGNAVTPWCNTKASDVHLSAGLNPVFRIDNDTRFQRSLTPLSSSQIGELIRRIAPPGFYEDLRELQTNQFHYHQASAGCARVSAFMKNGTPHCTFRYLPEKSLLLMISIFRRNNCKPLRKHRVG